jgi:hypothetical protein
LLLLVLIACGAPTAEERLRAKEIGSAKDDPPCTLYGYSQGAPASTDEGAIENLKVEAVRRDANFVVPDSFARQGGLVRATGRVYRCPDSLLRRPAPAPAACVPDCSPGYVCIDGKCLSACNPLCERGQRCGADRICH